MTRRACLAALLAASAALAADRDPARVLPPGQKPADARLAKVRTLNDTDFFLRVPATREAWEARRRAVREQVLVALGLWPLPEKTPLDPVVHGKVDRDGYTVEKVFFASTPGHYVSGNLYRPRASEGREPPSEKHPGVLCPHGHWRNGRFFEAPDKEVEKQLAQKAEATANGARYPLQARCAQLARMGCVVFHYDMVGVADSTALPHAGGFADPEALLRLQSAMGLQTWNSIRALDFLLSLPDVDPKRIGVTGASGGGTQTFILGAVDDRPAAAFPAVMVSTQMQGGCVCENAPYLRIGTGNVELAGLFAPRPLGMTGANDWTIDIERKGLPELKALYRLYGAEDRVLAKCFPQFEHNYNQVSREVMYHWFNRHLGLGQPEPVAERPFEPIPPKDLSVYDAAHPRPRDELDATRLRQRMAEASDRQLAALRPKGDRENPAALAEFRRAVGTALRVMAADVLPAPGDVEEQRAGEMEEGDGFRYRRFFLGRKGQGEQVPAVGVLGPDFDGTVVVWVHPEGKKSLFPNGTLAPAARQLLQGRAALLAVDVFGTGELTPEKLTAVDGRYAGYTFGYNRPLVAQRVHDILTAVAYARGHEKAKAVHLVGWGKAGPWVLLARGLCGDAVARTAADADGFRVEAVRSADDPMMLPGALKYGGLPALAALAAPGELYAHGVTDPGDWLTAVYAAAGAKEKLHRLAEKQPEGKVVAWLLR
jgi:dienelactone hydrolase